ncbi:MAG: ThuA domain-containing protein [Rhodothermales bacterium]|nr:ThuA domain-containing protein [Rhodothermales bacterium]
MLLKTLLLMLGCLTASGADRPTGDILVFSKTEGFRHDSIEPGVAAVEKLAAKHGLAVFATEDSDVFETDVLQGFRVVVFLNTTKDVLAGSQEAALTEFIRGGGGFVGIHSATDTEYDWPWYGQLVGAYFDGHPGNPNVREGVLQVVDSTHAATCGLPNPWVRTDEWYDFRYVNPNVNVLLLADELSYKRPEEAPSSEAHPISWYHEYDGGRAFYTGLGHTSESFAEPLYLDHIWGGIRYALGETDSP